MGKRSALMQIFNAKTLVPGLLAATVTLACSGYFHAAIADDALSGNLSKLEDKYFQHDFSKDEPTERLERLEKLVFGEVRTGSNDERLKNLLELVPNLNAKADDASLGNSSGSVPNSSAPPPAAPPRRAAARPAEPIIDKTADESVANDSSYPAVTAMEKKLLGRDYIGESVSKRLDRLEIKAFGKTNASDDLQDRVDRLKSATGVDVAKVKPANSEWADEEEDPDIAGAQGVRPFTGIAGDDPTAQRNYRKQQAQNAYNRPRSSYDPYAGTGTFGAGSSTPVANGYPSGTYGASGSSAMDGMPAAAPDFSHSSIPAPQMGVNQQLGLLEKEVFKKTYDKETILNRLSRLESTVFPQDKPAGDKSLPERMNRLIAAVPLSQTPAADVASAPPKRRRGGDPDFPDLDFNGPSTLSQNNNSMPPLPPPRNQGGLSKIINGLGNALTGGYTGSYATSPGTLVTDPRTGLLYDQYTGTYIDPMTGAVVSRRGVNMGLGGMGSMNGYGYPSYGGFNSGLSPMSPYGGMGGLGGMGFGLGGGGMRIGF